MSIHPSLNSSGNYSDTGLVMKLQLNVWMNSCFQTSLCKEAPGFNVLDHTKTTATCCIGLRIHNPTASWPCSNLYGDVPRLPTLVPSFLHYCLEAFLQSVVSKWQYSHQEAPRQAAWGPRRKCPWAEACDILPLAPELAFFFCLNWSVGYLTSYFSHLKFAPHLVIFQFLWGQNTKLNHACPPPKSSQWLPNYPRIKLKLLPWFLEALHNLVPPKLSNLIPYNYGLSFLCL